MERNRKRLILFCSLTFAMMLVIFLFSAQDGGELINRSVRQPGAIREGLVPDTGNPFRNTDCLQRRAAESAIANRLQAVRKTDGQETAGSVKGTVSDAGDARIDQHPSDTLHTGTPGLCAVGVVVRRPLAGDGAP